jgi:hypothetical protein
MDRADASRRILAPSPRRPVPEHIWQSMYARLQRCSLIAAAASAFAASSTVVRWIFIWLWPECTGTAEIVHPVVVGLAVLGAFFSVTLGTLTLRKLHVLMVLHHGRPEDTFAELEALIAAAKEEDLLARPAAR